MKQEVKELIEQAYELWLMDEYIDEIHNKDDLIFKSGDGFRFDEFIKDIGLMR